MLEEGAGAIWIKFQISSLDKLILSFDGWNISCEIALGRLSMDFTDDKLTLVQVMAWCRRKQAITWANVHPDICRHMA